MPHVQTINSITFSVCVPTAIIAKIFKKKFVIRVPGDFVWEQASQRFGIKDSIEVFQEKRYSFKIELLRRIQKWTTRQADLVVTCSDFLKKIVASWGVKENKLIRIYLGMDFSEFNIPPAHVPDGKILFSLGRFVPWKGFPLLIDLLAVLPSEWHLVIAGDGPLRAQLEQHTHNLDVSKRVLFTGALPHTEILGWFRVANAFALNTSFESFSFQILEAMASGTPVITTTIGSIPELLRDGTDGVLCQPNDIEQFKKAVESVTSNPELWEKRTTSAKTRAHEFSIKKSVSNFANELKKICD